MKRDLWLGAWRWTFELRVDWRSIALGVQLRLWSWRNRYPWLFFSVALPFVWATLDLTRPDYMAKPKPRWERAG